MPIDFEPKNWKQKVERKLNLWFILYDRNAHLENSKILNEIQWKFLVNYFEQKLFKFKFIDILEL